MLDFVNASAHSFACRRRLSAKAATISSNLRAVSGSIAMLSEERRWMALSITHSAMLGTAWHKDWRTVVANVAEATRASKECMAAFERAANAARDRAARSEFLKARMGVT